jgi:hypothetical protein
MRIEVIEPVVLRASGADRIFSFRSIDLLLRKEERIMRRLISSMLGLFVVASPAHATLINFDDGTFTEVIGSFYSPLGVTFSGATWQDNLGLAGFSGHVALASTNANAYQWFSSTPVIATFSAAVSTVSLTVGDLGENGFILNAYDALTGGNLVSTTTRFGTELGHNQSQILNVGATSILRVELFQAQEISIDGVFVEDFRFAPPSDAAAPEPGTFALLALGLIGSVVARRRPTKSLLASS